MDNSGLAYEMLSVCVKFAPTGKEQQAFGEIYNRCLVDGLYTNQTVLMLIGALEDGLKYGNWPQIESEVSK